MKCRAVFALLLAFSPAAALAQVDRAVLTGVVKDPQGAVVGGADVTITALATTVASKTRTNSEGVYTVINLPPGEHLVEVASANFQKHVQTVLLEVGQRARLDVTLALGAIGETVTVAGVTPLLDSSSATLGTVVDQTAISKLPLAIRNWDDLLFLVPGVQGDRYTEESGSTATGRTGAVNVHGQRSLNNNFMLDGVDNNVISTNLQELSTQVSRPSIDSINEFKVVTSPYSAEYGRSPGAAISVTTKAGTNRLHGTAYDYFRNKQFDSISYFAQRAGQPKPDNDQNQFGGNLGGPLVKSRAFFFVDVEATRISRGVTRLGRVPTTPERQGIMDRAITDPTTGQPFANNTVPSDRVDPVAAKLLALVPLPNTNGPGTNNFFRQPNVEDDGERYLGRFDLPVGTDAVFARYINTKRTRFIPGFFGGIADGTSTSAWGRQFIDSQSLVAGWTRIFGPTIVNELRASWVSGRSDGQQDPFGQNGPDLVGLRGVPDDPRINGGVVGTNIDGYLRLGSPNFMPKFQFTDQYQFSNALSWLTGSHQFKFGGDLQLWRNEYYDIPSTRGDTRYSGQFTGSPMADFLLGYVFQAELSNVYVVDQRHWAIASFVQDDWKVSDRLTMNLGLRYDFITPPLEAENRVSNFNPAGSGSLVSGTGGSLEARSTIEPDRNNFAPRIGAVYTLGGSTVVRGGYGLFYNLFDHIGSEDQVSLNPPGLVNNNLSTASGNRITPIFFLRDGFPADFLDPTRIDLRRIRLRAANRELPKMAVHQFGAGVEHALTPQLVVSADFVGTEGRNVARFYNLNTPLTVGGAVPYPNFGIIQWKEHDTESSYRALEVGIEKRMARNYSFRVAYTLSESIDQAVEHLSSGGSSIQDPRDLDAIRGPSDFDTRHRIVAAGVWDVPGAGSGVARAITDGWLLSGIFTGRSGRPFTVTQSSNNLGADRTGFPNLIGDPNDGPKTVDQWFNVAAYQLVASGTFGNAGRNQVRGPGWATVDMSVQRRFSVKQVAATLRWDVFNLFDRANFGLPARNVAASTAGTITTLAGDPRLMQFAVRLEF